MVRRPPRSTLSSSSAASDVYKRQVSTQSTGVSKNYGGMSHRLTASSGSRYTPCKSTASLLHQVEVDVILQQAADGLLFGRAPLPSADRKRREAWRSTSTSSTNDCGRLATSGVITAKIPKHTEVMTVPKASLTDAERGLALGVFQNLAADPGLTVAVAHLEAVSADLLNAGGVALHPTNGRVSFEIWISCLERTKPCIPLNLFSALLSKTSQQSASMILETLSPSERAVAVGFFSQAAAQLNGSLHPCLLYTSPSPRDS
eukprot:TRINITY_DN21379_c0_g1_i1.p1 TRINITY_DN21379_c0_g1~~TRINITY_DN21379_c0_g1_i1.p1  ORF type:complete len:260 (+),score=65.76 TRINITY_DN21379_c0_g1_i1:68-847(+)